jgi:hypothetical protein
MNMYASILRRLRSPGTLLVPAAMLLLTLFVLSMADALWVGYATIPLEFIVVDAKTNMPVSGSLVQLKEGPPEYAAPVTGQDGRTRLVIKAMCAGRSSIFRRTRSVNYGFWEARVEAVGYETFRDALSNLTRDHRYHDQNAVLPPILIELRRKSGHLAN